MPADSSKPSPSFLDDTLSRKVIFLTGKGGVGKTTLAWATALLAARHGARVAVAAWNPFGEAAPPAWTRRHGIQWVGLETLGAFREYVLKLLRFEKVYDVVFDNKVLRTFVSAAPGLSETVVAGKIWDLVDSRQHDLVVVDLPASGHAVSFFQSPMGIRKIFPTGFVHQEAGKIVGLFESRDCRVDLVALPEELPLVECRELKEKLTALYPFHFGFAHVNGCLPDIALPEPERLVGLPADAKAALERFRAELSAEKQTLELARPLDMPLVKLPKLPADSGEAMAGRLSQLLEAS